VFGRWYPAVVAQRDLLKRYLDAGMSFTAMTRAKAEAIVKELARAGEIQREQVQSQVDELVQRSRHNSDQLRTLVRKEVGSQFAGLGLVTKRDLTALERRLTERFGGATKARPAKKAAGKKTANRKEAAKKAAATRAAKKAAAEGAAGRMAVAGNASEGPVTRGPAAEGPATGGPGTGGPGTDAQRPQVSDS
jgi:polyhydroxyalkanoate synthesis regulator phasin